ncbi:unnamed protein product [Pylaiella littoralis]
MVQGCDSSSANTTSKHLLHETNGPGTSCPRLKINGKNNETPVADAKTLIQIMWLLPGKKTREFRHQNSEKVCRLLGGHLSLVAEIEARYSNLQSTDTGRSTQEFLLSGTSEEAVDPLEGMPVWFKHLDVEERQQCAKLMFEQYLQIGEQNLKNGEQQLHESRVALKRKRCSDMVETYQSLKSLGVKLDDRTLIELRDNVTILSRQDIAANTTPAANAVPLLQDSTTPTQALGPAERGPETGIVVVSSKIGIRVPQNMSGTVGKCSFLKEGVVCGGVSEFVQKGGGAAVASPKTCHLMHEKIRHGKNHLLLPLLRFASTASEEYAALCFGCVEQQSHKSGPARVDE